MEGRAGYGLGEIPGRRPLAILFGESGTDKHDLAAKYRSDNLRRVSAAMQDVDQRVGRDRLEMPSRRKVQLGRHGRRGNPAQH